MRTRECSRCKIPSTSSTRMAAAAALQHLMHRAGGEQSFRENWLANVDKDVVAGFEALSVPEQQEKP